MAKSKRQQKNNRADSPDSPDLRDARAARLPADFQVVTAILVFMVGLSAYLMLFFSVPNHREWWRPLLLPDEIIRSWFQGTRIAILDRMPVLLRATLILAESFCIGWLLLDVLRVRERLTRLEGFVFATGAGLNVISLWTLAAGLAGVLHNSWLMNLPAAALAGLAVVRRATLRKPESSVADPSPALATWLERYGVWLALPFAAVILLGGMMPPWQFDVREYHLQVPKEWYERGRIDFLPHNVYGNMPLGAEMPALLATTTFSGERNWWWGALVGKTVIAAMAPLTALLLLAAGRRFFSRGAGIVAGLMYLATPWVAHVSMTGLIDGVVAFYFLAAVYAFLIWRGDETAPRPTGMLLLAGFLAGAATACKYPAVVFVVMPLAMAVLWARPQRKPNGDTNWAHALLPRVRVTTVFLLAALAGCGLWFAKNWALTGNPTYPLLSQAFRSESRTPELVDRWSRAHRVPHDAKGRQFSATQLGNSLALIGWKSDWLNPLMVPLAVIAVFVRKQRPIVMLLAVLVVYVTAVWWLFTHRIDRFWVPVLPLVALLAGAGATWTTAALWRVAVEPVLVAGLLLCLIVTSWHGPPESLLSDTRFFVALDELRTDPIRVNAVHLHLNRLRETGCRVLLVGDAQPFDLEVPTLYSTCFDSCVFEDLLRDRSADERRAVLRQLGITHVVVHWSEIARYHLPGNYGFSTFVTPTLVYGELVSRQRLLRPVRVEHANSTEMENASPPAVELFEVIP